VEVGVSRLGISEAATLALALIVTMALAGVAIVFYQAYTSSASNAVRMEAAAQMGRMSEEVSIVYWIGSRLMLKNDGDNPVTIQRIFTDSGIIEQAVTINPGEKKVLTVPQSNLLVLQTASGSIIKLRNPQPSSGGGSSGGLKITYAQATMVGASNNAQINIRVKNTSSQTIYSISISIVGENGMTYVAPKNWLLNPGDEVQDTTVLSISDYGAQYYVRVNGFLTQGGEEVGDAVWLVLQ
jgi:hypothetical protein